MHYPLCDRAPKFEFNVVDDYVYWRYIIFAAKNVSNTFPRKILL